MVVLDCPSYFFVSFLVVGVARARRVPVETVEVTVAIHYLADPYSRAFNRRVMVSIYSVGCAFYHHGHLVVIASASERFDWRVIYDHFCSATVFHHYRQWVLGYPFGVHNALFPGVRAKEAFVVCFYETDQFRCGEDIAMRANWAAVDPHARGSHFHPGLVSLDLTVPFSVPDVSDVSGCVQLLSCLARVVMPIA